MVRPRGTVALVGMPGKVTVDLAPLWHREVRLAGAYAYGTERGRRAPDDRRVHLRAGLRGRRPPSRPAGSCRPPIPLTRFEDAVAHAGAAGRRGAVKIAFDVRKGHCPMSRRPGFVLEVDKSTPPTLFWNGEGFTLETLPEGSRVIYAPEPMKAIEDPYRAIRHALLHPVGDRDPLPALLPPGMKLTICFDDVSLPLPPDGGARHPPDGDRDRARHGGGGRRGRRDAGRRAGPAPPHDRGGAAARARRPGLRRLRPARPADPARRRGPRQPPLIWARPTRARRWRSTSGPPRRTCWST